MVIESEVKVGNIQMSSHDVETATEDNESYVIKLKGYRTFKGKLTLAIHRLVFVSLQYTKATVTAGFVSWGNSKSCQYLCSKNKILKILQAQ